MTSEKLLALIKSSLEDVKANDTFILDVRGRTTITDFIVIATGTSGRHAQAISDRLIEQVKKARGEVLGVEGREAGEWVLIDLADVVVHVMQRETRELYDLEQLWQTEIPHHPPTAP